MALGRPREFDIDKALETAMQIFWRKGYEGTTLSDLTEAMGINRPSLYAAFGNKEALFRKALDRYANGPGAHACAALEQPTALAVAEMLLHGSIDMATDPHNPRGCLMVQGALACGDEAEAARAELAERRRAGEAALTQRLQRALRERDLPKGSDPADLARYLVTIMQGLAVQAATGATRDELHATARRALQAWPTAPARPRSAPLKPSTRRS